MPTYCYSSAPGYSAHSYEIERPMGEAPVMIMIAQMILFRDIRAEHCSSERRQVEKDDRERWLIEKRGYGFQRRKSGQ